MKHLETINSILDGEDPTKALAASKPERKAESTPIQRRNGERLPTALRVKVNNAFWKAGLDGNGRFPTTGRAINTIHGVMADHDLEEDGVFDAFFYNQKKGEQTMPIAFSNRTDPFSPTPISNSLLAIQWTELAPGKFEYVVRLT